MSRAGANERKPQPIDIYAGQRIRMRRAVLGITQEQLAQKAGITFQQIQKYERGANRVSVSRLFEFAEFLGVAFEYFVEGFPGAGGTRRTKGFAEKGQEAFAADDGDRDGVEAVRILNSVPKAKRADYLKATRLVAKGFQ